MAETKNLPSTQKAADIRSLLERSRKQLELALPKHLTVDRLLRVAMTSIQRTPKLMDCSQTSLLACIMTCAQLGLEPDQFLGQAYLVPYWNGKKHCFEAQLIPGYRGYIALGRRSGEMQTVSAQVVYENDFFNIMYGVQDTLEHKPRLDGDRGKPIGAYVVFKYKDGSYTFDFMPYQDIKEVAKRSATYDKETGKWSGPWETDEGEMLKKTVIKRHAKLAPLSVEFQKAVALEERALSGESQNDLLGLDNDDVIEGETAEPVKTFDDTIPEGTDMAALSEYIKAVAAANKITVEKVKENAAKSPDDFWKMFPAWVKQQKAKEKKKAADADELAPAECPDRSGTIMTKAFCDACQKRQGCPVWA